jgi:hypothetical protein
MNPGEPISPPTRPWLAPPSDLGSNLCEWCDRNIHLPALPCARAPIEQLRGFVTAPGAGARCGWEIRTRRVLGD